MLSTPDGIPGRCVPCTICQPLIDCRKAHTRAEIAIVVPYANCCWRAWLPGAWSMDENTQISLLYALCSRDVDVHVIQQASAHLLNDCNHAANDAGAFACRLWLAELKGVCGDPANMGESG